MQWRKMVVRAKKTYREVAKWLAVFSAAAVSIGAIVLIVLHFVPGVNVTLLCAELVIGGVVAVTGACTVIAVAMSQDEVDRAIQYMAQMADNLTKMKESLLKVEQMNVRLGDSMSVEAFKETIAALIARADTIENMCSQTRKLGN